MIPDDWMPHRREDGETVGYVRLAGEGAFQAMDLLGRPLAEPAEWLEVERLLDEHSIAWLDGAWTLVLDGRAIRTRIAEVSGERVVLVDDRLGSIDGPPPERYEVSLPVADGVLSPAPPLTEWPGAIG